MKFILSRYIQDTFKKIILFLMLNLMLFIYNNCLKNNFVEHENVYLRFHSSRKAYIPSWENLIVHNKTYSEAFMKINYGNKNTIFINIFEYLGNILNSEVAKDKACFFQFWVLSKERIVYFRLLFVLFPNVTNFWILEIYFRYFFEYLVKY